MKNADLNLLFVLDALLYEVSISGAARRLDTSQSAMSRSVARLRETIGDQLLVRAGSKFVLTPRAIELKEILPSILGSVESALRPVETLDFGTLERTFTIKAGAGFAETFGPDLISYVSKHAPQANLIFANKSDLEGLDLRNGVADIEVGVVSSQTAPEIRTKGLFRDRFIGVIRTEHPLREKDVSLSEYLEHGHIAIHRKGIRMGPIDRSLKKTGKSRNVTAASAGFSTALAIARSSDLIATVPEKSTRGLRDSLYSFPLPFQVPEVLISLMWHPKFDQDLGNRWLRDTVSKVCSV